MIAKHSHAFNHLLTQFAAQLKITKKCTK